MSVLKRTLKMCGLSVASLHRSLLSSLSCVDCCRKSVLNASFWWLFHHQWHAIAPTTPCRQLTHLLIMDQWGHFEQAWAWLLATKSCLMNSQLQDLFLNKYMLIEEIAVIFYAFIYNEKTLVSLSASYWTFFANSNLSFGAKLGGWTRDEVQSV